MVNAIYSAHINKNKCSDKPEHAVCSSLWVNPQKLIPLFFPQFRRKGAIIIQTAHLA
jgi:hypothetical protein